jgi:putative transposase
MPRTARGCVAGYCYHVLNRGNAHSEVFRKPGDYAAFLQAIQEASLRVPMPLLAYCLLSNHFHLVVRPIADTDLSRWMHWLMTTHVRRYLKYYRHSGHVWQGRFKAFATQDDEHLITVVRYVERNPLRARLVCRAEDWPWSSLGAWARAGIDSTPRITEEEILRRGDWPEFVNAPMTEAECEAIRLSIRRNRPYGSESWTRFTAARLGLLSSVRSRGDQGAVDPGIAPNP